MWAFLILGLGLEWAMAVAVDGTPRSPFGPFGAFSTCLIEGTVVTRPVAWKGLGALKGVGALRRAGVGPQCMRACLSLLCCYSWAGKKGAYLLTDLQTFLAWPSVTFGPVISSHGGRVWPAVDGGHGMSLCGCRRAHR